MFAELLPSKTDGSLKGRPNWAKSIQDMGLVDTEYDMGLVDTEDGIRLAYS
jgi:hypothetical protein